MTRIACLCALALTLAGCTTSRSQFSGDVPVGDTNVTVSGDARVGVVRLF